MERRHFLSDRPAEQIVPAICGAELTNLETPFLPEAEKLETRPCVTFLYYFYRKRSRGKRGEMRRKTGKRRERKK